MADQQIVLDDLTQLGAPFYTPNLHVFSTPSIQTAAQFSSLSSSLSSSYQETISTYFPHLNFTLKRDKENGAKLTLINPGSIKNQIIFQEINDWAPTQQSLDLGNLKGWPLGSKLIGQEVLEEETHYSVKIKVTWCHKKEREEYRSVVVMGCFFSHLLFDGPTRNLFMNQWAAQHRKMFDCELDSLPFPSLPPVFDPSILVGNDSPVAPTPDDMKVFIPHSTFKEIFAAGADETKPPEPKPKIYTYRVLFPKSVLERLQREYSSDETKVSKNDCIFSIIWQLCQKIAPGDGVFSTDNDHTGFMAVSVRGRYKNFTPRHCGNAIIQTGVRLPDVRDISLGELARKVRQSVVSDAKESVVQTYLDWSHQIKERELGIYCPVRIGTGFFTSQWRNLNMYHTNFGPGLGGTPALVIPPVEFGGLMYTLPPRPTSLPLASGDEEEGVVAQFSTFTSDGKGKNREEGKEQEEEKIKKLLPDGVIFLTEMEMDLNL